MDEYPWRPYDSDSDPDDELDEDEVERNFDEEASLIVKAVLYPKNLLNDISAYTINMKLGETKTKTHYLILKRTI